MAYDPTNIFAKILRGEIPCDKVYEDEHALAFNDIAPKAPVHVLVIPKGPYVDIEDFSANASAEEVVGYVRAIGAVARQLGVTGDGFRILANSGADGGQEVPHLHVHLFAGRRLGPMIQPRD